VQYFYIEELEATQILKVCIRCKM